MKGVKDPRRGITISAKSRSAREHIKFLRRMVARAMSLVETPLMELSIALVSDVEMSRLHRQFLGVEGPTDVLTFELEADQQNRVTSGEIVICVPHARRAAAEVGTDLRCELLLYAIHGLLHLCGHDDRTRRGFDRMHEEEDRILWELGVGPVFCPPLKVRSKPSSRREGTGRSR